MILQCNRRKHFWIVQRQLHTSSLEVQEVVQEVALAPVLSLIKGQVRKPVRKRVHERVPLVARE